MQGAQLFQDLRQREQQALELNDTVLQGLVVAKMALDLDQPRKANEALTASIALGQPDHHRPARQPARTRSTCSAASPPRSAPTRAAASRPRRPAPTRRGTPR